MKRFNRYILPSLLILLLFGGLAAVAQNVNKALQLSQDATGAFGVDTNNNVYFPAHVLITGPGTPAVTTCGTAPTITGNDLGGIVTAGVASNASCTITFNKAYLATPYCIVAALNPATSPLVWSTSLTAITITTATTSTVFTYVCVGGAK